MNSKRWKNLRVVAALLVAIGGMTTLVSYSTTLYRLFCVATGYGGTTQRADGESAGLSDKVITVRFDTNTAPDLPWRFKPEQREVRVRLGEDRLVFFSAENLADQPIVGHATFNVSPAKAGIYFNKIQCFCFDDERLEAHQKVDMPVVFFVDPALATDRGTADVDTITLSYTFFRSSESDKAGDTIAAVSAEPDVNQGKRLFAERCTACHALDRNKAGPMLDGVFGRKAASIQGYNYSPALRAAGLVWTADNLERWLSGPRDFVAGSRMPVKVADPGARRDIITYLEDESRRAADGAPRASANNDGPYGNTGERGISP